MLKYMDEGKQTLEREIDKILKTGDISVSTLEKLHKLTDTYKNLCKIYMLSEEEEQGGGSSERRGGSSSYRGGSSYDDDMMSSERRGRGRNARRDSMGRYASEGGSYYEEDGGSSYERGGQGGGRGQGGRGGQGGGRGGSSYEGGYSRNDAKDWMMSQLGEMMEDADPKEREALKKCMRAIEEA